MTEMISINYSGEALLAGRIVDLLAKVCDLPDRPEKWALLSTLNDALVLISHPPMMVGSDE